MSIAGAPGERTFIRTTVEGGIALVTFDRPEALNAVNDALREQLLSALDMLAESAEVRAVVLTGEGRGFCAGGDLKAMGERLASPQGAVAFAGWQRMQSVSRAVVRLHAMNKVTIAAVNGVAAGLGCDLALCCDFVVCAPTATFAMSYLRRGLIPDGGGLYFLPRRVGLQKAKELIFTGRTVEAAEAVQIGLADRAVEDGEDLLAVARALAEEMTAVPLSAIALTKSILNRSFELSIEEVFALGASAQAISYTTDAHREAVEAFLASRRRD